MAIGVELVFRGATFEQYDHAMELLGLLPGGPAARGQLFHWVTKTDDAIRCIDVWESREAFEEFWGMTVFPVLPEIGVVDPRPVSGSSRCTTTSPVGGAEADHFTPTE